MYFNSRAAYLPYAELPTSYAKTENTQIRTTRTMVVLLGLPVPRGFFSRVPRNAVKSQTRSSRAVSATASVPV